MKVRRRWQAKALYHMIFNRPAGSVPENAAGSRMKVAPGLSPIRTETFRLRVLSRLAGGPGLDSQAWEYILSEWAV